jgi:hypothetical protein
LKVDEEEGAESCLEGLDFEWKIAKTDEQEGGNLEIMRKRN